MVPRKVGEKSYGAYWKHVVSSANLAGLRGQPENVSGRSLLLVLKTYGERIDNSSGEAWPSQPVLAKESGCSKRTVERAQALAVRLGFLVQVGVPIPGLKGIRYRAEVPPDWEQLVDRANAEVIVSSAGGCRQYGARSSSVRGEVIVSTDDQTLSSRTLISRTLISRTLNDGSPSVSRELSDHQEDTIYNQPVIIPAHIAEVWDEAERSLADEAAAKVLSGEKINHVEEELLLKWNAAALAPSFD